MDVHYILFPSFSVSSIVWKDSFWLYLWSGAIRLYQYVPSTQSDE